MRIAHIVSLSRPTAAGLAAVGVLWGGLAAAMPALKAQAGATDGALGFALLFSAMGGILAMAAAPRVGAALGRLAMPIMCLVVAGVLWLPLWATGVPQLAAVFFAIGVSVAGLDILTNVEISARETKHGLHLMGFNHAMFSFAFAGAAFLTGQARSAGAGLPEILPWLSLACVGLAALSYLPKLTQSQEDAAGKGATLPWGAVLLTGVILGASFIGENATEAWSALHIERTLGAAEGHGGFGPATLGLVMGFGRLFGQAVSERIGHARLIFGSACLGTLGTIVIALAGSPSQVLIGVAIAALGLAVVVPSAMSILGARVTEAQRAMALSRAWMLGIVGFFIGPALMGGLSELFGLRVSFLVIAAVIATILPAIWRLSRR